MAVFARQLNLQYFFSKACALFACLAFFSPSFGAIAQEDNDESSFNYEELTFLAYNDPVQSRERVLAFLETDPSNLIDKANAYDVLGVTYFVEGDFTPAVDAAGRALEIAKQAGDQEQIAGISLNNGHFLAEVGAFDQSVLRLREAAQLAEAQNNTRIWVGALTKTFSIIFESENFEAALPYARQASDIASRAEDPGLMHATSINLAAAYARSGRAEAAKDTLADVTSGVDLEDADAFWRLQTSYGAAFINFYAEEDPATTARQAQQCLELAAAIGAAGLAFDCRQILADLSLQAGEPGQAAAYLADMQDYLEAQTSPSPLKEEAFARQMAQLASSNGDSAKAVEFLRRQLEAAKTLSDQRLQLAIALSSADFEMEGVQLELSLEEARRKAAQAEAARARTLTFAVIIGLAISLFAIVMLYRNLALNRRVTHALARNLEQRELFNRDLRHRAKNNLQTILSLLNLHRRSYASLPEKSREMVGELSARVHAMAVLEKRLYEGEGELSEYVRMDDYLGDIVHTVSQAAGDAAQVRDIDVAPVAIEPEIAAPIGLIVSELLLNSFKYAIGATVRVALSVSGNGDELLLTVADDGPGLDGDVWEQPRGKRQSASGLGLQIVRDLVEQIDGAISLDRSGGGTVWRLSGPMSTVH